MSRYPEFANASAKPINVSAAVSKYVANEAALRRLALSRPVRNVEVTAAAIARRERDRTVIEGSLMFAGHLELVGWLTEQRKLHERLAEAKRHNIARPELQQRLVVVRRAIKKAIG